MIKIEITRKGSKKQRAFELRRKEYILKAAENLQREITENPELLETRYTSDEDIAFEVMSRVDDLFEMEKLADNLKGGWIDQIKYKITPGR